MSAEVYPVVHVINPEQAMEQSELAFDVGADGIFLIDHDKTKDPGLLLEVFGQVALRFIDKPIGVNILEAGSPLNSYRQTLQAFKDGTISRLPDAIWDDDAVDIDPNFSVFRQNNHELEKVEFFGGIAFKYQDHFTDDPEEAAELAKEHGLLVDVITTTGPGTSFSANPEKLQAMKPVAEAIGKKLAVASGVTPENADLYIPHVDIILVSSGIETESYSGIFVESKARELIEKAHN